ncbi:MAG TPA: ABC transporter permease, partial [Longimicrobiales bacterium]|nr:ABC transporter permease [Longimicrobiales bacterium]
MLRLYRLGLALLPPGFRRSYGRALLDEAAAALDEAPPGAGRLLCGARLGVDLARALAREWVDAAITTGRTGMGSGMIADVRWALRALRRAPGYALAIVGTLGLGIGASTAAFGLADAYLLRSLPYPESERLMVVWPDQNWSRHMVAMAREDLRSLEDVGGVGGTTLVLQEGGPPEELFASEVTTNFLDVMRVKPLLGRGFLTDDGAPGAEPVAVLAHALWAERFGSDPSVIGRTVALGGDGHLRRTVVGVMPPDHLPFHGTGVDAWVPVTMEPASDEWDDSYFMTAVARLAADATPARAAAETRGWAARVRETQPGWFSEEDVLRATATTLAAHET